MFSFFRILTCLSSFVSRVDSAPCCLVRNVESFLEKTGQRRPQDRWSQPSVALAKMGFRLRLGQFLRNASKRIFSLLGVFLALPGLFTLCSRGRIDWLSISGTALVERRFFCGGSSDLPSVRHKFVPPIPVLSSTFGPPSTPVKRANICLRDLHLIDDFGSRAFGDVVKVQAGEKTLAVKRVKKRGPRSKSDMKTVPYSEHIGSALCEELAVHHLMRDHLLSIWSSSLPRSPPVILSSSTGAFRVLVPTLFYAHDSSDLASARAKTTLINKPSAFFFRLRSRTCVGLPASRVSTEYGMGNSTSTLRWPYRDGYPPLTGSGTPEFDEQTGEWTPTEEYQQSEMDLDFFRRISPTSTPTVWRAIPTSNITITFRHAPDTFSFTPPKTRRLGPAAPQTQHIRGAPEINGFWYVWENRNIRISRAPWTRTEVEDVSLGRVCLVLFLLSSFVYRPGKLVSSMIWADYTPLHPDIPPFHRPLGWDSTHDRRSKATPVEGIKVASTPGTNETDSETLKTEDHARGV
ncbi:hypothetical protein B0H11DRAFT_2362784 [Mycena galericulata]|nr:hypothetical protein B0H11DRAFT_2362784 [Mycena galericulata]